MVGQVGDIVFVVLALDQGRIINLADVLAGVVDIDVDCLFEHFRIGIGYRQRQGRLVGLFEIMRPGMHLAAERHSGGPIGPFEQDRQEVGIGERADRDLDGDLVVAMEDDGDAARLDAVDRRGEQIPRGALHHIFDEGPIPFASGLPQAAGVVHELDVGVAVLELARHEAGVRIGDGAAGRQRDRQVAVGERGDDRWSRCRRN